MLLPLLATAVSACLFAFVVSVVLTWVSGKSAFWGMGLAVAIVVALTTVVLLAIVLVMRHIAD